MSSKKGINRFVWNLRHSMLKGIPKAYIEGNYGGHKAIPGNYKLILSYSEKTFEISTEILKNPMQSVSDEDFKLYDEFMKDAEKTYNEMTVMTNELHKVENQLKNLKKNLKSSNHLELSLKAEKLISELSKWDKIMVQRLSKAYDDVENFENGFTAHYLTMINDVDSELPRITEGAIQKMAELNKKWKTYKNQVNKVIKPKITEFNSECQKKGIGAIYTN